MRSQTVFGLVAALSLAALLTACSDDTDPGTGDGGTGGGPRCGDNHVDPGEECDQGVANSDSRAGACRTDCRKARCGDGTVDGNEACDDGAANDDAAADACRTDCTAARCGDGVKDSAEECDEGAENHDTNPGACRTSCRAAGCGDGVLDPGETCDEGPQNSDVDPDRCREDCLPARCGDGVVDTGEPCDDGAENGNTPDACRPGCIAPTCGDGIPDSNEGCDPGEGNFGTGPDDCRPGCIAPRCGDGVLDSGEECDEGDDNSDERPGACRRSCREAFCGDGVVDAGETCDEGANNGDAPGACRNDCLPARCGDGVIDPGEPCDDGEGNGDAPGACRVGCILPVCGDGITDPGEVCDDGEANNDEEPDACRTNCRAAGCGDGVLDTGEDCDDGNHVPGDDCTPACTFTLDSWAWQKHGALFDPPEGVSNQYGCPNCDGSPSLVNVNGTLHLFFARLPASGGYSRKLHHATSTDGVNFTTPVPVTGLAGSAQLDSSPVWDGTRFHLWYLETSKVSYATSTDGNTWTMVQSNVLPKGPAGSFDSALVRYPSVLPDGNGGWVGWYTGADPGAVFSIGRATSTDGSTWTSTGQVLAKGSGFAFDNASVAMPAVIRHGTGYLMWYGGYDLSRTNPGPWRIGAASSGDGIIWDKMGISVPLSTTGTDSLSVREPAVAPFGTGWVMIYVGLGDDGFWRLHRATSSYVLP